MKFYKTQNFLSEVIRVVGIQIMRVLSRWANFDRMFSASNTVKIHFSVVIRFVTNEITITEIHFTFWSLSHYKTHYKGERRFVRWIFDNNWFLLETHYNWLQFFEVWAFPRKCLFFLKDVFRFVNNQMRGQAIFQVEVCDTCSSVSETVLSYKIYIKSICTVIKVVILYSIFFYLGKEKKERKNSGPQ